MGYFLPMAGCAATVSSKPSLDGISLYRSSPWLPPLTHSIISSESTYPLFVVQSDLAGRPGPFLIPLEALYEYFSSYLSSAWPVGLLAFSGSLISDVQLNRNSILCKIE